MRAIRVHQFGDPTVLKLEELPAPAPAASQALVRVHAIGVNPVDTYIRSGTYGPQNFPFTPGYDASGVVERVGDSFSGFAVGERVVVYRPPGGTYAEQLVAEAKHLLPLPNSLSFEQGASLGVPYFTASIALFDRGRGAKGETVLVHGATGGVGLACVQLAHAAGLRVLGTGSTEKGRAIAIAQGADKMFDHAQAGTIDQIRDATGGRGPDLIIEMLANVNLEHDLTLAAPRGRIVIVGSRGKLEITPRLLMKGNLDVMGMSLHNSTESELRGAWSRIVREIEAGRVRPVVGETMPLAQAPKAHERIMAPGAGGKIILVP
ncbi:MAG: NADPH:quinone reductase [Phycisphaerales bacterium]